MEVPSWNGGGHAKTRVTENKEVVRKVAGREFFSLWRVQRAASAM